ncbi:MAG: COX15/CtaA family protein, partial [Bacteroidota bacterium]
PGGLLNLIENKITIHFVHRSLAYLILVLIIVWTIKVYRIQGSVLLNKTKPIPFLIVFTQVLLGILSVITSTRIVPNKWGVFEWMAQFHQFVAILLLISLVFMLYLIRSNPARNK